MDVFGDPSMLMKMSPSPIDTLRARCTFSVSVGMSLMAPNVWQLCISPRAWRENSSLLAI
jgi:hypothetical protein